MREIVSIAVFLAVMISVMCIGVMHLQGIQSACKNDVIEELQRRNIEEEKRVEILSSITNMNSNNWCDTRETLRKDSDLSESGRWIDAA